VIASIRIRLDGNRVRSTYGGREHRITSNVCTHIREQIIRSKEVQEKEHIAEFMEPAVNITGGPSHSVSHDEFRPFNPFKLDLSAQPTFNLPTPVAPECPQRPLGAQRVPGNEFQR
jgi:hypothetical protein